MTHPHSLRTPATGLTAGRPLGGSVSLLNRVAARIFAHRFDNQLAVGLIGAPASALAAHTRILESGCELRRMALVWRRILAEAHEGHPPCSPRVRVHRHNVRAAEGVVKLILLRLESSGPIRATGMARLRKIVADGGGPLYRVGNGDLDGRLRAALAAL